MKQSDIDNYNPDRIVGCKVDTSWFEALNMAVPTFMDADVIHMYRMCLDWESYCGPFVKSVRPLSRDDRIQLGIKALIAKYNPILVGET